jgi:hypothetical protein
MLTLWPFDPEAAVTREPLDTGKLEVPLWDVTSASFATSADTKSRFIPHSIAGSIQLVPLVDAYRVVTVIRILHAERLDGIAVKTAVASPSKYQGVG